MDDNFRSQYAANMHLFEQERRRAMPEIEQLWMVSENDPIVRAFLRYWQQGMFRSFEDMLCKLVVELSKQKEDYQNRVVDMSMQTIPKEVILKAEDGVSKYFQIPDQAIQ